MLVADTISNLLVFAPVQILTKGGPTGHTDLMMNDIFTRAYTQGDVGRGGGRHRRCSWSSPWSSWSSSSGC